MGPRKGSILYLYDLEIFLETIDLKPNPEQIYTPSITHVGNLCRIWREFQARFLPVRTRCVFFSLVD